MTWNVFRYTGDLSHLLSFFFLLHRLWSSRTSAGISLKTQELYLLVFITRYLDLFKVWHSWYNTVMKIIYIALSALLVYALRFRVRAWLPRGPAAPARAPWPSPPSSLPRPSPSGGPRRSPGPPPTLRTRRTTCTRT
jgi:hypothetical protein